METWSDLQRRHSEERRCLIAAAIEAAEGNRTKAARMLGMDRGAMLRTIRDQEIEVRPVEEKP